MDSMATLTARSPSVKPDVCWLSPPVWPCVILPDGLPGRVLVNDVLYAVLPLDDERGHTYAFAVAKEGQEEPYQVNTTTWHSDCPYAVYRGEGICKHATMVRDAFEGRVP
jgi:hypothetical protein